MCVCASIVRIILLLWTDMFIVIFREETFVNKYVFNCSAEVITMRWKRREEEEEGMGKWLGCL